MRIYHRVVGLGNSVVGNAMGDMGVMGVMGSTKA
jgi:hypothetical protein